MSTDQPSYPPRQPGYPPPQPGYPQSQPGGYAPQPGYPPSGYQQVPPPGYVLKKKKPFYKRLWFWLLIIFVVVIAIIIAAVASAANDAVNSKHTVVYEITGTAPANITYSSWDAGSNTEKTVTVNNAKLPWTQTVQVKGSLSGFTVTAIPSDITKSTSLECSLSVDGKVVSSDTGGSSLVSCSGSGYSGR